MVNVEFKNVDLNIKKDEILRGINLKFEPGRIYGLLGRNGAGKTTLLSLIATYRKVTRGVLTVDGQDPYENENIMPLVDFLHQEDYSEESETVEDYLGMAERYKPSFDMDYALTLLDEYKIDLKKKMMELSQGQQAAVDASMGLATMSPVVLFDEVTNGMDAPSREKFYHQVLNAKNRENRVIVLSTHIVSEMDYLFDEVVVIHHGKVLVDEPVDEFLGRGYQVTGNAEDIDEFTKDKEVVNSRTLGPTKAVSILGVPSSEDEKVFDSGKLSYSAMRLQDLFINMTED
ncbi:ATP-binding cassette domain-containing protein [Lacicoccus qingdaonensis]|uniref:ABC-2 type transport system ATP-binding protein n=1 Tax=Lacicoccus qingdaonensis TaxID=576118 RepID=A0A1G9BMP3_9BACL|nr:ABC transporter ATP-binding protein [Salinicoccus qingdaonensis]SDK40530.1 ABC-2 type transport system ATP-binding protein [Salinicoccus qingdaonensis]